MSELLALEPDPDDATRRLLEVVVGTFADWGSVHLLDEHGILRRTAVHHVDPALAPLAERVLHGPVLAPGALPQIDRALHDGRSQAFAEPPERLTEFGAPPDVVEAWRTMGSACGVIVPLRSGDRTVGVLALVSASPDRFPPDRVAAIEVAVREGALIADTVQRARRSEAEAGARVRVRTVLDALLGDAPLAALVVDHDLRVLHRNRAVDGLQPPGRARARGDGDPALVPLGAVLPDLAEPLTGLAVQVLAEGRAVAPLELPTGPADARRVWQVNAFPIHRTQGDLFGVGLIFVEVTAQQAALAHQQESRARLELSLEAGGMGSWEWDLATGRVEWSAGMEVITGIGPEGLVGAEGIARMAGTEADRLRTRLVEAASSGEDLVEVTRVQRPGGEERWVESRARVIQASDGVRARMLGVSTDVTERQVMEDIKLKLLEREHQARLAAEASRERLALLAEVSGVLTGTLDPQEVYATLARILVPRFADWCTLDALGDDGELSEMAVVHGDPRLAEVVRGLRDGVDGGLAEQLWSVRRAMRTGRSERVDDITDDDLRAVADDPADLRALQTLLPRSALVAPLIARGRVLGGVTLVASSRAYDADDQNLLENIAGRAATAIDTAMLFDSRSEVARALQQTLLPPALPEIPGLDVWADYRVAEAGIEIGGDFYDLFETDQGWYVVLGDVCGKGPAAAAVTGLFRHTLRAVAPGVPGSEAAAGPAELLGATSDAILDQIDDTRFATAVLVQLTPGIGGARAAVACGGHPRPVLVRGDGTVERIDATGTLLGVLPDPPLQEVTLDLGPGDSLVLYTDGVTEARDGPEQFGEGRLMQALQRASGLGTAREISGHLIAAVDAFRDPQSAADDIAVVAIRVPSLHDAPA